LEGKEERLGSEGRIEVWLRWRDGGLISRGDMNEEGEIRTSK